MCPEMSLDFTQSSTGDITSGLSYPTLECCNYSMTSLKHVKLQYLQKISSIFGTNQFPVTFTLSLVYSAEDIALSLTTLKCP